jgi:Fur family ferric uptake transcriptional regulator/Fur family peroxide stress response transcriptional regulator
VATGSIETSLVDTLRSRGQRVTPQRLAIARVVGELDGHVTVEGLYREVSGRLPGVSLPTVYATLELLEELGLVRRVSAAGGSTVYDGRTERHHHMICRRCGAIADVDVPVDTEPLFAAAAASGFAADDAEVVVSGLCEDCRT